MRPAVTSAPSRSRDRTARRKEETMEPHEVLGRIGGILGLGGAVSIVLLGIQ
jgi:hypothetical protein